MIIIIGAGVSGLALANGFAKHNVPFRVYERDPSLGARTQGYRVRISDDGIDALEHNLSAAQFEKLKRSCNSVVGPSNVPSAVLDASSGEKAAPLFKPGQQPAKLAQTKTKPLSADRSVLRQVLLETIEEHVCFGKQFRCFREKAEGGVAVTFEDGEQVEGTILVGADGAWSKVRRQLMPTFRLLDTEGRLLFGKTALTPEFSAHFSSTALQGLTMISGQGLKCLLEPMRFDRDLDGLPADYVYWVLFLRSDSIEGIEDPSTLSGEEALQLARTWTSSWNESLRGLFDSADARQVALLRIVTSSPSIPSWVEGNESGAVTLVGDAIHPMSPTAALGATTALQDAGCLARLFVERAGAAPDKVLREYESQMRAYARVALEQTVLGGRAVFGMKDFEHLPTIEMTS